MFFSHLSSDSFAQEELFCDQSELVYENTDPAFGFTVVSYHDDRPDEWLDYRLAIVGQIKGGQIKGDAVH